MSLLSLVIGERHVISFKGSFITGDHNDGLSCTLEIVDGPNIRFHDYDGDGAIVLLEESDYCSSVRKVISAVNECGGKLVRNGSHLFTFGKCCFKKGKAVSNYIKQETEEWINHYSFENYNLDAENIEDVMNSRKDQVNDVLTKLGYDPIIL